MRWQALLLLLICLAACAPAPEPTPVALADAPNRILEVWDTVSDTLDAPFEAQPYQFVGQQGDAIHLRMESDNAGVTLALQAPDGSVLAHGSDMRVTLATSGIYTAVVRRTPGTPGSYTLRLEYAN